MFILVVAFGYACDAPEPEPAPRPRPTPVATRAATPAAADLFRQWFGQSGYPAALYAPAVELVQLTCSQIRAGADPETVLVAVQLSIEAELREDVLTILGAGMEAYCPRELEAITR